jgi:predicted DNA repair protein MutK
LLNKVIIVPIALLLNAFFPAAIKVILILGGFYLAYEGVEKIIEYFFHRPKQEHEATEDKEQDPAAAEKAKIKSAVATDFILSIEIVIIALGTVLDQSLTLQIITVSAVALLATIGVYGIVALIVRMDDAGYKLIESSHNKGFLTSLGKVLVKALPIIIRILGVVGTIALVLVSGGIFVHNIDYLHHVMPNIPSFLKELAFGLAAGLIAVGLATGGKKIIGLAKA